MRTMKAQSLLLVLAAIVLAGCTQVEGGTSNAIVVGGDDDGYHGVLLTEPYTVPTQKFEDTAGAGYSLADDPDTPLTLVFFGYTHCPDICQIVMSTIASALNRLEAGNQSQVSVVFVTTDPERDTGPVLRDYLDQFDPAYVGLTSDIDTVIAVGDPLGVYVAKGEQMPSGGYEVDHGTPIVGITPDGTAPLVWQEGTSPAELAEDIEKYLAEGGVS
jgi:protein SCO1/2